MNQPLDTAHPRPEAVGPSYSIAGMQHAATQTILAEQQIAAQLRPGMSAAQAQDIANATMQAMGAERTWHPHLVRIGSDTQKIYSEQDDTSLVLGEEDIFFIDLGLVFNGQEGDAGATFTLGENAEMQACAQAAETIWQHTAQYWLQGASHGKPDGCTGNDAAGRTGAELYAYAAEQAARMGYVLNPAIKGHRLSDYPHATHQAVRLADYTGVVHDSLWVLEIQIRHPQQPFGAFYEALLSKSLAA